MSVLLRISSPITLLYHSEMDEASELFVLYKQYSNNGKIWLMLGLDTTGSDYYDILAIAECLAKEGHEVKVLHAGKRPGNATVHLLVDGEYVEYESYKTDQHKKAFRNMLHNGLSQSERIILRHCFLTDGYMSQQIRGQINNGVPVSCVWIFDGSEVRVLYNTEG